MKETRALSGTRVGRESESVLDLSIPTPIPASYGVEVAPASDDADVHLRDYWRMVRRYLWLIVSITLVVTMLTAIYVARKPDMYAAQARVQVDLESVPAALGNAREGAAITSSSVNDPAYFNTQLQILTGHALMRRVVKTLDLETNPQFLNQKPDSNLSTWQSLQRMFAFGDEKEAAPTSIAAGEASTKRKVAPPTSSDDLTEAKRLAPYVDKLLDNLKVEPVKETRLTNRDTRLIDISYTHPNPQIAAAIVNAIADAFEVSNLEKKVQTNNAAGSFLEKRIAELQGQIRNDEERLIQYAQRYQILSLNADQNTVTERLLGLNRQLLEAENERKFAEAAYNAARAPGAVTALAEDNAKQAAEAEAKLADLRQKRAQLLVEVTEEWGEVKEVDQQIAVLENYIRDTRNRAEKNVLANLETRYRQAAAREDSLRGAFRQQSSDTLVQNESAINYRIIQQEIETNKRLLDGLLQRSKENDVILAGMPNNIHAVDYAVAPNTPIGPKRLRTVGMAFLLSLTSGIGLALFLNYFDNTVRSAEDVEKQLQLPVLAVVPAVGGLTNRFGALSSGSSGKASTALTVYSGTDSPLAEAYRQLRTSVMRSPKARAARTLLVASSLPGEGKTTTAINTATSLALTGASVVIIDADLRHPRLHTLLGIDNTEGLSTILSGEVSEADSLSVIKASPQLNNLHVLTSGAVPMHPAELLDSDQMNRLLAILAAKYTYVIIDSPPLVSFSDSAIISSMVDGVFLVVQGGRSTVETVRRARKVLQDIGANIIGVVLNNVKLRAHERYYHYYPGSYYRSHPSQSDAGSSTLGLDQ